MDREALLYDWLANLESGCADSTTNEAFVTASFLTPPVDQGWAWELLLEGLRRASSEKAIGVIGASSLENLLMHDGEGTIRRVEEAFGKEPNLRLALAHVWRSSISEPVWQRVQELRKVEP